jgi:hypothetical protein
LDRSAHASVPRPQRHTNHPHHASDEVKFLRPLFCPQCQAEYRQGFTVCADCDADLVHSLPTEATLPNSSATQANGNFCPIWRGIHQNTCVEICLELKAAGIHQEVTQSVRSHIGVAVEFEYELAVAGDDVKQATSFAVCRISSWRVLTCSSRRRKSRHARAHARKFYRPTSYVQALHPSRPLVPGGRRRPGLEASSTQ